MDFVNEIVSKENYKKYDLESIDKKYVYGNVNSRGWTIDYKKEVFLKKISKGREEFDRQSTWVFYWKGKMLEIKLESIGFEKLDQDSSKIFWRVLGIKLPNLFETERELIISNLVEALTAYKDDGIHSAFKNVEVKVDVAEMK